MDLLRKTYRVVFERIYRLMFERDASSLDYVDILSSINICVNDVLRKNAIKIALDIRNNWAHECVVSAEDVYYATGIIRAWLASLIKKNSDSELEEITDPILLLLDVWLLGNRLSSSNDQKVVSLPGAEVVKEIKDENPIISFTDDAKSNDKLLSLPLNAESQPFTIPIIDIKPPKFILIGTLKEIKSDPNWREAIKNRRVMILDGYHCGQVCTVKRWSGTVVIVIFDTDVSKSLNIDRKVGVLRRDYIEN
jgi:hypothetical protein